METHQPLLTKTTFLKLLQCEKALYLNLHKPHLKDPTPPELKHRFIQGHKIGALAQLLFPGGIDISKLARTNAQRLQLTIQYINDSQKVLYEATLAYQNLLVMVDILVKTDSGYNAYEVKSSTRISDTYTRDAQLQYWVLQHTLKEPVNMHLVFINPEYQLQTSFDIQAYFKINPITITDVDSEFINQTLQRGINILQAPRSPQILPGKQCTKPYRCDFHQYCNPLSSKHGIPIPQLPVEVTQSWIKQDVKDFMDLPLLDLPSKYQSMYQAVKTNAMVYDLKFLKKWLQLVSENVIALDIETWTSPKPEIENTRAWESIPFLAAVYGQKEYSATVFTSHTESDQRYYFINEVLKLTEEYASVLVYDKTLETQTILKLGTLFPALNAKCQKLCHKFCDVFDVFKNAAVYHPEFKHQFNLKQVSRVLNPHIKLDQPLQHGIDALMAFQNYRDSNNPIIKEITETDLKAYCINDARMTFELYNSIKNIVQSANQ